MQNLQGLHVKDAYRLNEEEPIVVKLAHEISQIIDNFAHHTELSGIFVVEDEGRFAGVITRTDLLDWARVKLGAALLKPATDRNKALRLVSLIDATEVSDILRQETIQAAVSTSDTLAHAMQVMIEADLIILPVVDEAQHIIGSLTLSELLDRVFVESHK
jgi:CBS-domain-containing membrane protein